MTRPGLGGYPYRGAHPTDLDHLSKDHAERLARRIEAYWHEKRPGCILYCWAEPIPHIASDAHGLVFGVRSTMRDGWPA